MVDSKKKKIETGSRATDFVLSSYYYYALSVCQPALYAFICVNLFKLYNLPMK